MLIFPSYWCDDLLVWSQHFVQEVVCCSCCCCWSKIDLSPLSAWTIARPFRWFRSDVILSSSKNERWDVMGKFHCDLSNLFKLCVCVCVCLVGIVIPFNSACVWFSFGRCWCWNSFVVSFALGRKAWMEHSTHNTDLRVILKLVDFFNKWTVFVMECGFVNFPNHHFDVQVFGCLKSFEPKHNLYNFLIWNLMNTCLQVSLS